MKFKVGDRVLIKAPEKGEASPLVKLYQGVGGQIEEVGAPESAPYPYVVKLDDGHSLCFGYGELEPEEVRDFAAGDAVDHPPHYTQHPSGVECIQVTEHMTFSLGNAMKYIWRAGLKSADPIEDIDKAIWYLQREKERLSQ